jgi:hypothetical protein
MVVQPESYGPEARFRLTSGLPTLGTRLRPDLSFVNGVPTPVLGTVE